MKQPRRVGFSPTLPSHGAGLLDNALWAEEHGYESIWFRDGSGRTDAFTLAAAAAVRTSRARIALGIVPVFTRPAAVFATSAATMAQLAPGRFILGLGASSQTMIEGWYGIPFVKPRTRVKETVYLLRKMLAGEKVDWQGETIYSRGFRLNFPPLGPIPIYLAALRPGMLELAGEIADGVVLNLAQPRVLPRMLESIDTGAKRSGRRVDNLEVALLLNCYVTRDVERARKDFAAVAANYFSAGVYNKFLAWSGYEKEAARITEGFREKDRAKTLGTLPDEVLDELAAIGDPARCRGLIRRYWDAGVNTCIVVSSSPLKEEHAETLRAFTTAAMAAP